MGAAAGGAAIDRAVFISTTAIFTHLDATSKGVRQAAEDAIRSSALRWTIIRPTMIYGTPGDRNMARLLAALRRWPLLPLPGGGRRLQQPVHVDDVAAAAVSAVETEKAVGKAYDVAGPEALTLRAVVEEAAAAAGVSPRLVPVPLTPLVAGARLYEAVTRRPHLRAEQLERLAEDKAFDIGPARADLDYDPRPFAQGIKEEASLLA
jgi:nucleoside-diphosphate-sugar epimerase